uniref:Uncharacterized protein n=1 Tax=Anguilla anguilla TaxID=7936 RepID=A0A0E9QNX6_ANGAN
MQTPNQGTVTDTAAVPLSKVLNLHVSSCITGYNVNAK